jgi:hypothetical protein
MHNDDDIPSLDEAWAAYEATQPMTHERLRAMAVLDAARRKHCAELRAEKTSRVICATCGKRLRAREPLVALRFYRRGAPSWRFLCIPCDRKEHREDCRGLRRYPYAERLSGFELQPCPHCERPMHFDRYVRRPVACSYQCGYRLKIKKQLERRRVQHEEIKCMVCGESFISKRSDAKTCSNACRQAQHRARSKARNG